MSPSEAAQKILAGDLVVFPTETVYGLGALAGNDRAVKKIFAVKGRPSINPLILHIADVNQLTELVVDISPAAQKLIDAFWPGPLTICFRKSKHVSDLVSAGLSTVCVRMPAHHLAKKFLQEVGEPVAAPSANLSGKPSTTSLGDAEFQLAQAGVCFLDGGESTVGLESTIVDCSDNQVKLLRPGSISKPDLVAVIGQQVFDDDSDQISSPGQLLKHYAPQGKLTVVFGQKNNRRAWFSAQYLSDQNLALGIVGDKEDFSAQQNVFVLSKVEDDLGGYAANLYKFLNWCDQISAKQIFLELPDTKHQLLTSIKNRLEKASSMNFINC